MQLSQAPVLKEGDVDSELEFNGRANDAVIATQPGNLQVKNVPINGIFVTLVLQWNTKLLLQRFNVANCTIIAVDLHFAGVFFFWNQFNVLHHRLNGLLIFFNYIYFY